MTTQEAGWPGMPASSSLLVRMHEAAASVHDVDPWTKIEVAKPIPVATSLR